MRARRWLWSIPVVSLSTLVLLKVGTAVQSKPAAPLAVDAVTLATPLTHSTVAVVRSDHPSLANPVLPTEPLTYEQVRDMVWTAIELAPTKSGLLPSIIPDQSWVVVNTNMVFIKPQRDYSVGDITDPRVTKAVLEYLAERSQAHRVTLAMGGSWRGLDGPPDPRDSGPIMQNGVQVDGWTCTWGDDYPGFTGTLQDVLTALAAAHPEKTFDRGDFNYDVFPDLQNPRKVPVPVANGIGGWSADSYYVSNMILNCDVLIALPAMKVHNIPGISLAHKTYMGTASRLKYGVSGWWLGNLHSQPGGPDAVFADLFSYHPADYVVMGGAWGMEGRGPHITQGGKPIRTNMVIAGQDPVATDAVGATIMGFNPWDIEHLRRSAAKGYGILDLNYVQVTGDPIDRVAMHYEKPAREGSGLSYYYGRGNRIWLVHGVHAGAGLDQDVLGNEAAMQPFEGEVTGSQVWTRLVSSENKVSLKNHFYTRDGAYPADAVAYAFTYVSSPCPQSGSLWVGADDGVRVWLNGELVLDDPSTGSYRLVEDQVPVSLRQGTNSLLVKVRNESGDYAFSLALVDEDGDTLPGVFYLTEPPATAIGSETSSGTRPQAFALAPNHPNPFNGSTIIDFSLAESGPAELVLYDLAGQRIRVLLQGSIPAGEHALRWDGRDPGGRPLASGPYLYRLQAGTQSLTRKLLLLR
jgi:uncharacterized protein (DUF362 family)